MKKIFILIMKIIAPLFYDKKYLCGKYFDDRTDGWVWVFKGIWHQKLLGFNRRIPWVTCTSITISSKNNIEGRKKSGYYEKSNGMNTTDWAYYLEVTAIEDSIVIAKIVDSKRPAYKVREGDWIYISK